MSIQLFKRSFFVVALFVFGASFAVAQSTPLKQVRDRLVADLAPSKQMLDQVAEDCFQASKPVILKSSGIRAAELATLCSNMVIAGLSVSVHFEGFMACTVASEEFRARLIAHRLKELDPSIEAIEAIRKRLKLAETEINDSALIIIYQRAGSAIELALRGLAATAKSLKETQAAR